MLSLQGVTLLRDELNRVLAEEEQKHAVTPTQEILDVPVFPEDPNEPTVEDAEFEDIPTTLNTQGQTPLGDPEAYGGAPRNIDTYYQETGTINVNCITAGGGTYDHPSIEEISREAYDAILRNQSPEPVVPPKRDTITKGH